MEENKINENCPNCDSSKVYYASRLGGAVGYNDIVYCLDCETKFMLMYMNDKPVHKKIMNEGKK